MKLIRLLLLPAFPLVVAFRWVLETMYGYSANGVVSDTWQDWWSKP